MQVLKYIEDSFNSFDLRIKIELFIIPIFLLAVFLFFTTKPKKEEYKIREESIIKEMQALKMKDEIVNIIKDIENYASKNSFNIKSISSDNKKIKIELFTNKKQQIKFIKYLEDYNNFSKIQTLFISGRELLLELSFQKLYLKEKIDLEKEISKLLEKKEINFKLQAVIGKKVLINNKWLKINETIDEYKLIQINTNDIILENHFETIKLKVYKNEDI